ncbi:MAG TPA: DNA recombination protein RmuC [Rhizomicrobium sp.]|jgi:DNA recombination protein RmuC|nr:DNA recombination protein RmuC [Rhizomicrobium sp.]
MDFALVLLAVAILVGAGLVAFALTRRPAAVAAPADPRLDSVMAAQGEIAGRFQQTVEAQAALQRTLSERLDALNKRLGESLHDSAEKTAATLGSIGERLNVIDEAQKNIAALSGQVVSLQEILSDKQTRGAFAQDRMEAIVRDQLAPSLYDFQFTLSNGKRPDCIVRIPGANAVIVIDSKFPHEAFEALRAASEDERKLVSARLKTDVQKHVDDISGKYVIPGETQTPAIMFVPSESIYAELHVSFSELVQKARRQNVVIVGPNIFMLAIGTIQSLMRDAKMREKAHEIQKEVGALLKDVTLLGDRVGELRTHFEKTSRDIGEIEKPMKRVLARAANIERVEIEAPAEDAKPKLSVV